MKIHRYEGKDVEADDEIRQFEMELSFGQNPQYDKLENKVKEVYQLETSPAALYWKGTCDKSLIW